MVNTIEGSIPFLPNKNLIISELRITKKINMLNYLT